MILARLDMSDGFWVTSKKDELFFLVENNCQQTFFRFLFHESTIYNSISPFLLCSMSMTVLNVSDGLVCM